MVNERRKWMFFSLSHFFSFFLSLSPSFKPSAPPSQCDRIAIASHRFNYLITRTYFVTVWRIILKRNINGDVDLQTLFPKTHFQSIPKKGMQRNVPTAFGWYTYLIRLHFNLILILKSPAELIWVFIWYHYVRTSHQIERIPTEIPFKMELRSYCFTFVVAWQKSNKILWN